MYLTRRQIRLCTKYIEKKKKKKKKTIEYERTFFILSIITLRKSLDAIHHFIGQKGRTCITVVCLYINMILAYFYNTMINEKAIF